MYVTCGHTIFYDITLAIGWQRRRMINIFWCIFQFYLDNIWVQKQTADVYFLIWYWPYFPIQDIKGIVKVPLTYSHTNPAHLVFRNVVSYAMDFDNIM